MYPSDVPKKLQLSSSPKDQSLLTLRFPKKLWKIVNECRSGAISWSSDGTAVVIDYSKFQSDYLDNRLDIFKTNNITSFIRQLNLYGFRKVSPHYRVPVGNPENADVHVFRNDSFVRGRPDLLQGVTRKTGALRARMMHQKDDPCAASSSGSAKSHHHGVLDGTRIMHCQGRSLSSRHRQMALRRALDKQHDAFSRMDRSSSSRSALTSASASANPGPSDLMTCDYAGLYWEGVPWYSQDSTSDTTSSDDDYEYDVYPTADDIIGVNAKIKEEPEGDYDAMADGLFPAVPQVPNWTADCGIGDGLANGFFQQATSSSNSNSPSPSPSGCGDMVALLDPNKSPKVVLLHQGREDERNHTPPLEDSFMLDSVMGHIGESLGDNLYYILMTEDGMEPSAAQTGGQTPVGMGEAGTGELRTSAFAGAGQRREIAAMEFQGSRIFGETWEGDDIVGSSSSFKSSSTGMPDSSAGAFYCI